MRGYTDEEIAQAKQKRAKGMKLLPPKTKVVVMEGPNRGKIGYVLGNRPNSLHLVTGSLKMTPEYDWVQEVYLVDLVPAN